MDSKQPEILRRSYIPELSGLVDVDKETLNNLVQIADWNNQDIWYMVMNRKLCITRVAKEARRTLGSDEIRKHLYGVLEPW